MARGPTALFALFCVLALGGHVHTVAALADGSPPATCDATRRPSSSCAQEGEDAALVQMEPGLARATSRKRRRGGKGGGSAPAPAPPPSNDGGIAGYLGWIEEPSPQWKIANCGLAFGGAGCKSTDCTNLQDCAGKCSACQACGAVKFIESGGGGFQCFMMRKPSYFNAAEVAESNPNPAAWTYYVEERKDAMVFDGCKKGGEAPVHQVVAATSKEILPIPAGAKKAAIATRCCKAFWGTLTCVSKADGLCLPQGVDYETAASACKDIGAGWGLCTKAQLLTGKCCGTGCQYNHRYVWTADI